MINALLLYGLFFRHAIRNVSLITSGDILAVTEASFSVTPFFDMMAVVVLILLLLLLVRWLLFVSIGKSGRSRVVFLGHGLVIHLHGFIYVIKIFILVLWRCVNLFLLRDLLFL